FFLRKIFRRSLDSGREITRLAKSQHPPRDHKSNNGGWYGCNTNPTEYRITGFAYMYRECVHDGPDRPDDDGPDVSSFCSQPVDKATRQQQGYGIHKLKYRSDIGIISIAPSVLFREPGSQEAEHLPV